MPSPFPGMDPWLENPALFPELHHSLITYLRDALNAALPKGYIAVTTNRVVVDNDSPREPDVSVVGRRRPRAGGTATLELPGVVRLGRPAVLEARTEAFLEIRTALGQRLVTAIEVLSPTNKTPGRGRVAYLQKQDEMILGGISLVELDLLRTGLHTTVVDETALAEHLGDPEYHAAIVRPWADDGDGDVSAVPIPLRRPLPAVPIPLDARTPAVVIQLQPLLNHCYDMGRYDGLTDYTIDPAATLTADQQAWADTILREKGLRG